MTKPIPELVPPRCPRCHVRMVAVDISPGPEGFEQHCTFECEICRYTDCEVIAIDPMKSGAVGWTLGELAHGAVTHEVHEGRMNDTEAREVRASPPCSEARP